MTDSIRVRGARTRNLQGVDLDLPRGRITLLTGVSGSGKTSLALGTLHAEAQHRYVQALGGEAGSPAPPVDLIEGLPPTLALPARPPLPADRDVGELAGCVAPLAVLFCRLGVVRSPTTGAPLPASTPAEVAAALLALPAGSRLTLLAPLARGRAAPWARIFEELRLQGFSRVELDGRRQHLDDARPPAPDSAHDLDLVVDRVKVRPERADRIAEAVRTAMGAGSGRVVAQVQTPDGSSAVSTWADHPWDPATDTAWPRLQPDRLDRRRRAGVCLECAGSGLQGGAPCPGCGGSGAGPLARLATWGDRSFADARALPAASLLDWLAQRAVSADLAGIHAQLRRRLRALVDLGLGHLPLDRRTPELAMGERGRLALAARTSHELRDLLFVLDEPTSHLGPAGVAAVGELLRRLRDGGLTVVVVDHHPAMLQVADHVVEFGPGAGLRGGRVLYAGAPAGLAAQDTPTGRVAAGRAPLPPPAGPRAPGGILTLRGATGRNLQGVTLEALLGGLTVVAGPSGAGKRTLVAETLAPALAAALGQVGPPPLPFDELVLPPGALDRLVQLERAGRSASPRSCVATACAVWGPIRELLAQTREARVRGFGPEHFSFNTAAGRCPACDGRGEQVERHPSGVEVARTCPECEGDRVAAASRPVRWNGHAPGDLLQLDVDAARTLFDRHRRIRRSLRALSDVGLGHLPLGRPTRSLSGGEHQRLQLARELARAGDPSRLAPEALSRTAVVLDTPTAGLHPEDAVGVAEGLRRMAEAGATVVCADLHPALLAAAHRVVRLGPGAGPAGGRVVGIDEPG